MNIKERIGQRIQAERLAKGLTRKALAELTDDLKQSRINNWERGERTPGPEEIKQLAKALEVEPSYLMCLSDDRQPKKTPGFGALIPVLSYKQACEPAFYIQQMKVESYSEKVRFTPVSSNVSEYISDYAFAIEVKDQSMAPEFRIKDMLIVDPDTTPNPGDYVAAKLEDNDEMIIRKYKQLSSSKNNPEFELVTLNRDWADIKVGAEIKGEIIGSVICLNRAYTK